MSFVLLLPGFGGTYTSESFSSSTTTGADVIDASRSNTLSLQVTSKTSPSGTIDLQQSFNGGLSWSKLATLDIGTDGAVTSFSEGPYGLVRFGNGAISAGTAVFVMVGNALQREM